MVTRWGMSEALGLVQYAPSQNEYLGVSYGRSKSFSDETAKKIDLEIRNIIKDCHNESIRLLIKYRKELDLLATALLELETLDEQEILHVTGLPPAPKLENKKIDH